MTYAASAAARHAAALPPASFAAFDAARPASLATLVAQMAPLTISATLFEIETASAAAVWIATTALFDSPPPFVPA